MDHRKIDNFFHVIRHGLIKIWIKSNKNKIIKEDLKEIEDQLEWLSRQFRKS